MRTVMKEGKAIERLVFFVIMLILMAHVLGCMWVFTAKAINEDSTESTDSSTKNWITTGGYEEKNMTEIYFLAVYFAV